MAVSPPFSRPVVAPKGRLRRPIRTASLAGLLGLLGLALGVRLFGLGFGLPQVGYYWDEPSVVNHAVRFGSGDLNPHWFYYPALYLYLIFAFFGLYALVGLMTRRFDGLEGFAAQFFLDPTDFYLIARLTTVVIGCLTVWLLFQLGRRWFDELTGWLAGLLLAVSVLHSSHSHLATTDITLTFFFLLSCWPLLEIGRSGRRRDYLLTGLCIGLGMAAKYLTFLIVPAFVLAHVIACWRSADRQQHWPPALASLLAPRFLLGLVAILVGFFLGSPFNLLDLRSFLSASVEQYEISRSGTQLALTYYFLSVLPGDLGWPLLLIGLAGWPLIYRRLGSRGLVLLAVPGLYLAFMILFPKSFPRYMVPLSPFLALAAALALSTGLRGLYQRWANRPIAPPVLKGALALVTLILIAQPVATNLRWGSLISQEVDPRTQALQWIRTSISPDTPIAVQSLFGKTYPNAPVPSRRRIAELTDDLPNEGRLGRVRQRVLEQLEAQPLFKEVEFSYDLQQLRAAGVRYIITSDAITFGNLVDRTELDGTEPEVRFFADLQRQGRQVAVFRTAPDFIFPGPFRSATLASGQSFTLELDQPYPHTNPLPYIPPTIRIYQLD